jgi:hypothetical protein
LNPKRPQWAPKWAKALCKIWVSETPRKEEFHQTKVLFWPPEPTKCPRGPKMGESHRSKISVCEPPQKDKFPRVKFEFGRINIVVGGSVVGPQKFGKAPQKISFWR